MFKNIGGKIKGLATVICWIGIIISIIVGIVFFIEAGNAGRSRRTTAIITGVGTIVGGSLVSWIGSFLLYGFGQLVENSDKVAKSNEELIKLKRTDITNLRSLESQIKSQESKPKEPPIKKQEEKPFDYDTPKEGDWICPNCGQRNRAYIASCINCLSSQPKQG